MNIKKHIVTFSIVILIIGTCIGCIHPQQNNNQSNSSKNSLNTSENIDGHSVLNITDSDVNSTGNEHVNISSIDYSAIHVLPSYNDTTSEWLKTNASFVAKIALNDSRAQEVLMSGGKILGVIDFCHPTPSNYSGPACAPALMIQSGTNIYSFSVNESEKKVVYMGIGIDQDVRSVETFIKDLKDENPSVRSSAAEGLIWNIDERAVVPLIEALNDKEGEVRMNAATALGEIGDEKAIAPLARILNDTNEETRVRISSAFALENIGGTEIIDPLIQALEDRNDEIRIRAAIVFGQTKSERAVQPLILALKDENWEVRMNAVDALGSIGNESAIIPLIQALNDENMEVRTRAAHALGEIGNESAVEPLIQVMNNESEDQNVKTEAAQALDEIKRK